MKNERTLMWEPWDDEEYIIDKREKHDEDEGDLFTENERSFTFNVPINIRTPLGVFNSSDPMLPSRLFSCWVCHTNFDIGQKEYNVLMKTPGIEIIRVLSRYRFFMGVGKLFNMRDIRRELNKELCGKISKQDEEDDVIFTTMA